MARPYINYRIEELEALFRRSLNDAVVLQDLSDELRHHKKKRALKLKEKVDTRLIEIGSKPKSQPTVQKKESREGPQRGHDEKTDGTGKSANGNDANGKEYEAPDDLKHPQKIVAIRPTGTKGLPDAYVRSLNNNIKLTSPPSADPLDQYIEAVAALIAEMKKSGAGQRRYELENGKRLDSAGDATVYSFIFVDEAELFEDAPVEVEVQSRRVEGNIVSISAGQLLLSLKQELGDRLGRATLIIDATVLLEALRQRLIQVKAGEISLNRIYGNACVGKANFPPAPPTLNPKKKLDTLDRAQQDAYERALQGSILFLWGPPGCGKTRTLGEIVRSAFEARKRILVCSTTNRAVDEVLKSVCKALGVEHDAMREGKVVRLGRIVDAELQNKYAAYVTVDGIVERRSKELRDRKNEIEEKIFQIDARTKQARDIIARFELHDGLGRVLDAAERETNDAAKIGKDALNKVREADQKLAHLKTELDERRAATFKLFKRSEDAILKEIDSVTQRRTVASQKATELKQVYDVSRSKFDRLRRAAADSLIALSGLDRMRAQREVDQSNDARNALISELREIESKIANISAAIIKDAKVLGATCTKAYLSVKDLVF